MKDPKWWEFWKANDQVEDNVFPHYEAAPPKDNTEEDMPVIGEPIRAIVMLMIKDRKRFVFQKGKGFGNYTVLDLLTEEEFKIGVYTSMSFDLITGIDWATREEALWAFNKVMKHYQHLTLRASRIKKAKERNRLIEIYK